MVHLFCGALPLDLCLALERPGFLQVPRLIPRSRRTEVTQGHRAVVFQAVRLSRRNENAVAGSNPLRLAAHGHQPTAFEDEVGLLWPMAMKPLLAARLNHGQGCGQMLGAAGPRRGQQVRSDPFRAHVPWRCLFLEDVHGFLPVRSRLLYLSGAATNASPARTMIGSGRPTQPHSPTVSVASRPNRSWLAGAILTTITRRRASTPSGLMRGWCGIRRSGR